MSFCYVLSLVPVQVVFSYNAWVAAIAEVERPGKNMDSLDYYLLVLVQAQPQGLVKMKMNWWKLQLSLETLIAGSKVENCNVNMNASSVAGKAAEN